jgi:hypothetical protein
LACDPINIIASFRNAGISSRVDETGTAMALIDRHARRCLPYSITMEDLVEFRAWLKVEPALDSLAGLPSFEGLPFWLQVLEEEASRELS